MLHGKKEPQDDEFEPMRTSTPTPATPVAGRLDARVPQSPAVHRMNFDDSTASGFSIISHETRGPYREKSPSEFSIPRGRGRPSAAALRERNMNISIASSVTSERRVELAPHPSQHVARPKKPKGARNQEALDDDDVDNSPPKRKHRLITVAGRPGRKAIGRKPNLDESILKKLFYNPSTLEADDPYDMIKKPRERILGECAQVGF
jgi:hypothetical protein